MGRSYIDANLRRSVLARADDLCEYCLFRCEDSSLGCEVDHVVGEKHGGATESENLALACVFCNRYKGSDVGSIIHADKTFIRFFNPRNDRWSDHFRLDGALIEPLTDIAEVTVRIFRMNLAERWLERWALIEIGDFPCPAALRRIRGQEFPP